MSAEVRALCSFCGLLGPLLLLGCGSSAAPAATAPAATAAPSAAVGGDVAAAGPAEPEDAAGWAARVDTDEQALDRSLARGAQKDHAPPRKEPPRPNDGSLSEGEPCADACKALASLRRSTERLCALTGERDGRCEKARSRANDAGARVKSVCPTCPA